MYLSRMALDLRKTDTMKALVSPNLFHGAIEESFSGERSRNLWRIDSLYGERYLLIVSREIPDLTNVVKQFGREDRRPETKDYAPLLQRIKTGSKWGFRLVANPVCTVTQSKKKIVPHATVEYQKKWFLDRMEDHGFTSSEESCDVTWRSSYTFRKKTGQKVTFSAAAFEGVLTVTDGEKFQETLVNGIGREKAYGMGMMTVVRVRA